MTAKHHRNDPPFFAKFKNWVLATGGSVEDRLYERGRTGEQTRGLMISPGGASYATALFLHGTGNDLTYPAVALYKQLCAKRIRICAFDLDGHGARGSSLLSAAGIRDFIDWAVAQIAQPNQNLFIIGHSFGGTLALDYAARCPRSLTGLILLSAPLWLNAGIKSLVAESASVLRRTVWSEARAYGRWDILPALGPFKRASYPVRLAHPEQGYISTVEGIIADLGLRERLDTVCTPTLLIYGTGDLIVSVANAELLKRKLIRSESIIVGGATHFSTILEPAVPVAVSEFIERGKKLGSGTPSD